MPLINSLKILNDWLQFKAEKYIEEFIRWVNNLTAADGLPAAVFELA